MGDSQEQEGRMEGWLHCIRSGRFGFRYSQKMYFVLEGSTLNCFKSPPMSKEQDPNSSALLDSTIHVTDDGRESIHRKVLHVFTLYNSSNHSDQLKLGARNSEAAARWIHSLTEATMKESSSQEEDTGTFYSQRWQLLRFSHRRMRRPMHSIDWTCFSSMSSDSTSDVVAPSPWTIFGCKNGLRLFREAKDADFRGKCWDDDHPAIMAVGVVDASSEAIFQTVMSLGSSRSEWDFCFSRGTVVEQLDRHNDIIYKQLMGDWSPWGMKCRDLLLRRYWRREDDGTYVILYHSVFHKSCPSRRGFVRACLKSGGYAISPVNQGKQSVVKHMLAIDWRFWKSYLFSSSTKYVTIRMLGRIAALREFFRANPGISSLPEFSSGEISRVNGTCHEETSQRRGQSSTSERSIVELPNSESKAVDENKQFLHSNDASEEFFDVLEDSECGDIETRWSSDDCLHSPQDQWQTKLSSASAFVKKLHDLAVQKRGYVDLQEAVADDRQTAPCFYGATLPKDPTCHLLCSWSAADPSTFLTRGKSYLQDQRKIAATGTLMQMVGADWLRSYKREDDLAGRTNGIVQKYAAKGGKEFFFIVNIQVPGSTTYSLALYYMMDSPIGKNPLLKKFVEGDDAYKNSRFKLIPYISKGSWIVKQSVGKKACLIGQALEIKYFRGTNYLELGIDIGSSTVARGVVSLVLGYLNNLVIEMAFLIQANDEEELPEFLLGTCRLNHLDAGKSIPAGPW